MAVINENGASQNVKLQNVADVQENVVDAIDLLKVQVETSNDEVVSAINDVETDTSNIATDTSNIADAIGTHDAAAPSKIAILGGVADTGVPTPVADGDAVRIWYDEYGRQIIGGYNNSDAAIDASIINQVGTINSYETAIDGTIDDSPTFITSSPIFVGDCDKVGIMLRAVIDSTGNDVVITCSIQGGPEDDDLADIDVLFDSNGEDAPQSSIALDALGSGVDGTVVKWAYLPIGFNVQWITITMDGNATVDADDTAVVDAYVFKKKG